MPDVKLTAMDSNALPWEERPNEKIGRALYRKNLIVDPDTGMEVRRLESLYASSSAENCKGVR
jgi:CxxC motif-containing protein (DUF1111 family)